MAKIEFNGDNLSMVPGKVALSTMSGINKGTSIADAGNNLLYIPTREINLKDSTGQWVRISGTNSYPGTTEITPTANQRPHTIYGANDRSVVAIWFKIPLSARAGSFGLTFDSDTEVNSDNNFVIWYGNLGNSNPYDKAFTIYKGTANYNDDTMIDADFNFKYKQDQYKSNMIWVLIMRDHDGKTKLKLLIDPGNIAIDAQGNPIFKLEQLFTENTENASLDKLNGIGYYIFGEFNNKPLHITGVDDGVQTQYQIISCDNGYTIGYL